MYTELNRITDMIKESNRIRKQMRKTQAELLNYEEALRKNEEKIGEAERQYRRNIEAAIRANIERGIAEGLVPTVIADDDLPY